MKSRLLAFVVLCGLLGCNAIFGISEGTLGSDTGASSQGGGGSTTVSQGGTPSQGGGGSPSQGGGGAPSTGGTGGVNEGGGGAPPEVCDPLLLSADESIGPNCGRFVDKSAPNGGTGSQTDPFNDLDQAIASGVTSIYVCGSPTFGQNFSIIPGYNFFGGLACDWTADATQIPTIQGASTAGTDTPALTVQGVGDVRIQRFHIRAADAVNFGGSSVALFVNKTVVSLENAVVEAGKGRDGDNAAGFAVSGTSGNAGGNATTTCMAPPGGAVACPGASNVGGNGAPCDINGQAGQSGGPPGQGGPGGFGGGSCGPGGNGTAGFPGMSNSGAFAAGHSLAGGHFIPVPPVLAAGMGTNGTGAGGGGSRNSGTGNGGGGGSGGCGGNGGLGGSGGGASIAILVSGGGVDMNESVLIANRGGNGGTGGTGQAGGAGGGPGAPNGPACPGGVGGPGGTGGFGGGGAGGPAVLVMQQSATIVSDAATWTNSVMGTPGLGGSGATGAPPNTAGETSITCDELIYDQQGTSSNCVQH